MHPSKVNRTHLSKLTDLPNIGPAGAKDLLLLGVQTPEQLIGMSPLQMYQDLCLLTGQRHDPCVLDVFISVVRFMQGETAQAWWCYTEERKTNYPDL
jgi:hypothetical protein